MDEFIYFPERFARVFDGDVMTTIFHKSIGHHNDRRGITFEIKDSALNMFLDSWVRVKVLLQDKYSSAVQASRSRESDLLIAREIIKDTMSDLLFTISLRDIIGEVRLSSEQDGRTGREFATISKYPSEYFGLILSCTGYRTYISKVSMTNVLSLAPDMLHGSNILRMCADIHESPQRARDIFNALTRGCQMLPGGS